METALALVSDALVDPAKLAAAAAASGTYTDCHDPAFRSILAAPRPEIRAAIVDTVADEARHRIMAKARAALEEGNRKLRKQLETLQELTHKTAQARVDARAGSKKASAAPLRASRGKSPATPP